MLSVLVFHFFAMTDFNPEREASFFRKDEAVMRALEAEQEEEDSKEKER